MALLNFELDWGLILEISLELFIALGGVAASVALYQRIYKFFKNSMSVARLHRVLVRKYTLFDMMLEVMNYVEGERLLLLRLENGGNAPEVTKPLYTTVIEETYTGKLKAIKARWQHRLVDIPYIKMLVKMGKGTCTVKAEDLEKDSLLKNAYEAAGIVQSEVCYVSTTKEYMYYISIGFLKEKKLNGAERDRIGSFIDQLREII